MNVELFFTLFGMSTVVSPAVLLLVVGVPALLGRSLSEPRDGRLGPGRGDCGTHELGSPFSR